MDFKKEMTGFFVHSVCLPEKVRESFKGLSDRVLELKWKNGASCHVGLIASGDKLILQPGWSNFVYANNVSQNDILLFKFMGGSKFEVQIFDPTGREKINDPMELVSTTKITSSQLDNSHVEKSDEVKMKLPPLIKGWARNHCKLRQKRKHKGCSKLSYEEKEENMFDKLNKNKKEMRQHRSYLGVEETSKGSIGNKELPGVLHQEKKKLHELVPGMRTDTNKEQSQNLRKCVAPSNEVIYQIQFTGLNGEQKRRSQVLASKVQGRNPAFIKVITRYGSTIKCRMHIPTKFAAEQLPKETQNVVLCRPKKKMTWPAKYYYGKGQKTIEGALWRKFVKDNNLQEGDICLFEMVKAAEQITFIVHISRAK
ncbi:B3 domain-containing protein [Rhynchospora pubera]|uniref:B3 domain-containing protein n=1 Tax=Rhynchospora pubera TaxID=906938 RepID=A0AAV8ENS5_9POAL|nr:B3 domain-containing protein [Rhynchospora pubera]